MELLPTEVPPPEPQGERRKRLSCNYGLFAFDIVVSLERAVAWLRGTEAGRSVRPNPKDGLLPGDADAEGQTFAVPVFVPEPPAPALVVPTMRVPFVADWHETPRVRHLIAQSDPSSVFTPEERTKAAAWLENEVHLNLCEFPEFWGSVHLIAPNPVFRSLRVRPDGEPKQRSGVVVSFVPRTGRSVAGLTLVLEEERPTGLGVLTSVTLDGPVVRIAMPVNPGSVRERVIDSRRGLLHDAPFGIFDVGFAISTRLSSQKRRVAPTRREEAAYEVALSSSEKAGAASSEGSPTSAGQILRTAAAERRQRVRGADSQRWFRARVADAVEALRETIGKATDVFLCDPYFGGDDLHRIVLAMTDPAVPVRILTSEKFLRFKHLQGTTEGAHLMTRLAEARRATPVNPIAVHVMTGGNPAIHDRFLYVGERLWMLGSSLNHFGGRGTLMLNVPDPDPVLEDLERVWNDEPELTAWVAPHLHEGSP